MEEAAVAYVHLGCSDLTLGDVGEPRLELAHDQGVGQSVQIAAHGRLRYAQCTGQLGSVPGLRVIVGQHRPEAAQRGSGEPEAEVGQIPLQEGRDEIVPPGCRRVLVARQRGAWEASPQPQTVHLRRPEIRDAQATELDERDPPRQGLGRQPDKPRGGAAEDEEPSGLRLLVGQDPQHGEQVLAALSLVDDHRAAQARKAERWLPHPGQVPRVLQVEEIRGGRLDDYAGQGGLTGLERSGQQDDRHAPERGPEPLLVRRSPHQGRRHTLKSYRLMADFQGTMPASSAYTQIDGCPEGSRLCEARGPMIAGGTILPVWPSSDEKVVREPEHRHDRAGWGTAGDRILTKMWSPPEGAAHGTTQIQSASPTPSAVERRSGSRADVMQAGGAQGTEQADEHGLGKGLQVVEGRHTSARQALVTAEAELAGCPPHRDGHRGYQHPLHDLVGRVTADYQIGAALGVGGFAPPQLAAGYHQRSQGSCCIERSASCRASSNSAPVSGTRE